MASDKEQKASEMNGISRRDFVRTGSLIAAGAAMGASLSAAAENRKNRKSPATPDIPQRTLGRTGLAVSQLGLGTALLGHQNRNRPEVSKLVDVFSEAIDRGITYVDTARIYGRAEEALKPVLKARRDKVTLATKVWAETAADAEKSLHDSLKTMGVDSVDILHLHSAGDKNMDQVLGKGGSWEYLRKAREAGKARFIGITGHSRPANFVRLLKTGTVDVMMVAMNFSDRYTYGFEEKVLPVAIEQKTGVMAMKVFGGVEGGFKNYGARKPHRSQMPKEFHRKSIGYVKQLKGVTGMVIGVHSKEQLLENIRLAVETPPLSAKEVSELCEIGKKLAPEWNPTGGRFGPAA